jgi:predicted CopG family antitoxin
MSSRTTINIEKSVRQRLFEEKNEPTETYNDVLERLLEQNDE